MLRNYFHFGKRDRIGVFTLLTLLSLLLIVPGLLPQPDVKIIGLNFMTAAIDSLQGEKQTRLSREKEARQRRHQDGGISYPAGVLFIFDPNLASPEEWKRLGLGDKAVQTIGNYLKKGGRFRNPEDLNRIWGLPQGFYEKVKTCIRIAPEEKSGEEMFRAKTQTVKRLQVIDINAADTTAFMALPGIGRKLAARIVMFREKLGGFYEAEQLAETYGIADSVFQKIKPYLRCEGPVRKLPLNKATKEELEKHPYVRWKLAHALIEYRNQHGDFKSPDDLMKIHGAEEKDLKKLLPYLEL